MTLREYDKRSHLERATHRSNASRVSLVRNIFNMKNTPTNKERPDGTEDQRQYIPPTPLDDQKAQQSPNKERPCCECPVPQTAGSYNCIACGKPPCHTTPPDTQATWSEAEIGKQIHLILNETPGRKLSVKEYTRLIGLIGQFQDVTRSSERTKTVEMLEGMRLDSARTTYGGYPEGYNNALDTAITRITTET